MKRIWLMLSVAGLIAYAYPAFAQNRNFTVINKTKGPISRMWVAEYIDNAQWTPVAPGNFNPIPAGGSSYITFDSYGVGVCNIWIKVQVDYGQKDIYYQPVNLCSRSTLTIWYDYSTHRYQMTSQ
jgi:hypothetical protein